jgi:hypothetical protein
VRKFEPQLKLPALNLFRKMVVVSGYDYESVGARKGPTAEEFSGNSFPQKGSPSLVDLATGFLAKRSAMGIESGLKLIRDQLESRSDY